MKKEAANAFLKTLEEPPPETYIILLSTRPYSLLATIRSRCLLTRLPAFESAENDDAWESWKNKYQEWIYGLLDRESLKKDRISPLFTAYGLAISLINLISKESDKLAKELKKDSSGMDEKEIDALEVGVRKGVRSKILRQLAESAFFCEHKENLTKLPTLGIKLARVIACLEKNVRLMEVNLKMKPL